MTEDFPGETDIKRVLGRVGPQMEGRGREGALRADVISSLRLIRDRAVEPAGTARSRLSRTAAIMRKARIALAGLPPSRSWSLFPTGNDMKNFLDELDRVGAACWARAEKMRVRPSGGDAASTEQKLIAAERAFDLLNDWAGRVPTLTRDGEYIRLAGLLYKIATGRRTDMERACRRYLARLREDYPSVRR